mgnify:CR=1 FL=1
MNNVNASMIIVLTLIYGVAASGWAAERVPHFYTKATQSYFEQKICKENDYDQYLQEPADNPHNNETKPQQMLTQSKAVI